MALLPLMCPSFQVPLKSFWSNTLQVFQWIVCPLCDCAKVGLSIVYILEGEELVKSLLMNFSWVDTWCLAHLRPWSSCTTHTWYCWLVCMNGWLLHCHFPGHVWCQCVTTVWEIVIFLHPLPVHEPCYRRLDLLRDNVVRSLTGGNGH